MVTRYTTAQLIAKIQAQAAASGIDANIAVEQLRQESVGFATRYVYGPDTSPTGAGGVAQFMPDTATRFGLSAADRFDPDKAIPAWAQYMTLMLGMFNGRYDLALAGYNWGEHRTTLQTALAAGQSILNYSIPSETRNYITTIFTKAGYDANALYGAAQPAPTDNGGDMATVTAPANLLPIDVGDLGTINVSPPPGDILVNLIPILLVVGVVVAVVVIS